MNGVEELRLDFSYNIIGPFVRDIFRCLTKGPDVTAAFLKGHFCELSSDTVTVGELSIFAQTAAAAFIEHYPITVTATIEP